MYGTHFELLFLCYWYLLCLLTQSSLFFVSYPCWEFFSCVQQWDCRIWWRPVGWEGLAGGWDSLQGISAAPLWCSEFTGFLDKDFWRINLCPCHRRRGDLGFGIPAFYLEFKWVPLFSALFLSLIQVVLQGVCWKAPHSSLAFCSCSLHFPRKRGYLSSVVTHPIILD